MCYLSRIVLACVLASASTAQGLKAELIVSGVVGPVDVEVAPGDPTRWMVAEKAGKVKLVKDGVLQATPFLDIGPLVSTFSEGGLLGLAFHPQYDSNGRFFVHYADLARDTAIVEYQVSGNPDLADPAPVRRIYSQFRPSVNHYGGALLFGPDGMLYASLGDGNGGVSWSPQLITHGLGKVLRFDIDAAAPFVPVDNPFVGVAGADQTVWAYGLRNPWRLGFDVATGDLWIADVGLGAWEEINVWRAGEPSGANFGWPCHEGTDCLTSCNCSDPSMRAPYHQYATGSGCAVIGGSVYRGAAMPALDGAYFFADFCNGSIWTMREVGGNPVLVDHKLELAEITNPTAFGVDPNGEMLVCSFTGGSLWRIVPACGASAFCEAAPNSTGGSAQLSLTGSTSILANTLDLRVSGLPSGTPGYFLMARDLDFVPTFGGSQGNLCLGAQITRFAGNVLDSGPSGEFLFTPDLTNLPNGVSVLVGEDWRFQCWYRDLNPAATSNTSSGLSVRFCD